jgi:hypothetical protein
LIAEGSEEVKLPHLNRLLAIYMTVINTAYKMYSLYMSCATHSRVALHDTELLFYVPVHNTKHVSVKKYH